VAMGADQGCLISYDKATQIVDPLLTARILVKAIEHSSGFDLVICGSMTEDTTNRIVGPAVSAFLKWNHMSNVTKLEISDSGNIVTTSEDNITSIRIESSPPIVISVNRTLNEPRLATKIQIMKVPMNKIKTLSLADLSLPDDVNSISSCELESFAPISKDRKQVIFSGEAEESANNLINQLKGLI
jgi:electron transfer flavoprotein beta subunit